MLHLRHLPADRATRARHTFSFPKRCTDVRGQCTCSHATWSGLLPRVQLLGLRGLLHNVVALPSPHDIYEDDVGCNENTHVEAECSQSLHVLVARSVSVAITPRNCCSLCMLFLLALQFGNAAAPMKIPPSLTMLQYGVNNNGCASAGDQHFTEHFALPRLE